MPKSTGDERVQRQREAVEREFQRVRESDDGDLVDRVGEEQRRERAVNQEDDDDED
jgi:hypothetical protein